MLACWFIIRCGSEKPIRKEGMKTIFLSFDASSSEMAMFLRIKKLGGT
jgi:hypothetical protein